MAIKIGNMQLKIEKKKEISPTSQILSFVVGVLVALGFSAILISIAGANVLEAIIAIFKGAFGGWESLLETLVQSTPIIFTGLAAVIAFRARFWNIGAEGQFFAGALLTTFIGVKFASVPGPILLPILVVSAMIGGALWGFIPGILKAVFKTNEIIVTVMLNYVMIYLVSFMLSGPLQEPGQFFMQSSKLPPSACFPVLLSGSRLHLGFVLAVLLSLIIFVVLFKTPLGFDIRALGENPIAAQYKGINAKRVILIVAVVSGAIAGLAGGSEVLGLHNRLRLDISINFGYTGIIIALLGKLNPLGVIIAGIIFGALINGSTSMMIYTGVPVALVYCVQGFMLICVLSAEVTSKYRIRRISRVD